MSAKNFQTTKTWLTFEDSNQSTNQTAAVPGQLYAAIRSLFFNGYAWVFQRKMSQIYL